MMLRKISFILILCLVSSLSAWAVDVEDFEQKQRCEAVRPDGAEERHVLFRREFASCCQLGLKRSNVSPVNLYAPCSWVPSQRSPRASR